MYNDRTEIHPAVSEAILDEMGSINESFSHVKPVALHPADFAVLSRQLLSTDLVGIGMLLDGYEVVEVGPFQGDADYYVFALWHMSSLEPSEFTLPVIEWASMVCLAVGCDGWNKYGLMWRVNLALSVRRRHGSGPASQKWIHAARSLLMYDQEDWCSRYRLLVPLLIELTYVDTVGGDDVITAGKESISAGVLSLIECLQLAALGRMSLSHPHLSRFSSKQICGAVETVFAHES